MKKKTKRDKQINKYVNKRKPIQIRGEKNEKERTNKLKTKIENKQRCRANDKELQKPSDNYEIRYNEGNKQKKKYTNKKAPKRKNE